MKLMKWSLGLLTLSASVVLMNGMNSRSATDAQMVDHSSEKDAAETTQTKIARAISAGPADIATSAKIIDKDAHGNIVVLREGSNGFTCMPGNPKAVGDPPMCADATAMQWFADFSAHKAKPSNTQPGIVDMVAGATHRKDRKPYGTRPHSPTNYPHWMNIWAFYTK